MTKIAAQRQAHFDQRRLFNAAPLAGAELDAQFGALAARVAEFPDI